MKTVLEYTEEDVTRMEIRQFVNEGLKDAYEGNLTDVDKVFDKLEKRYADILTSDEDR